MNVNQLIEIILDLHGEYSYEAIQTDDPGLIVQAKTKAGALNDLLEKVRDGLPTKKAQHFEKVLGDHFNSFSRGLFRSRHFNPED